MSSSTFCYKVGDELLTPEQVAERLAVPVSWVYEQTRERANVRNGDPFPAIKMGRYLRFAWPDVVAWMDRRNRGTELKRAA